MILLSAVIQTEGYQKLPLCHKVSWQCCRQDPRADTFWRDRNKKRKSGDQKRQEIRNRKKIVGDVTQKSTDATLVSDNNPGEVFISPL